MRVPLIEGRDRTSVRCGARTFAYSNVVALSSAPATRAPRQQGQPNDDSLLISIDSGRESSWSTAVYNGTGRMEGGSGNGDGNAGTGAGEHAAGSNAGGPASAVRVQPPPLPRPPLPSVSSISHIEHPGLTQRRLCLPRHAGGGGAACVDDVDARPVSRRRWLGPA